MYFVKLKMWNTKEEENKKKKKICDLEALKTVCLLEGLSNIRYISCASPPPAFTEIRDTRSENREPIYTYTVLNLSRYSICGWWGGRLGGGSRGLDTRRLVPVPVPPPPPTPDKPLTYIFECQNIQPPPQREREREQRGWFSAISPNRVDACPIIFPRVKTLAIYVGWRNDRQMHPK